MRRHMLAVALVCELHKTMSAWKDLLVDEGFTPFHKLESAVQQVQVSELRTFLVELLERAKGSAIP